MGTIESFEHLFFEKMQNDWASNTYKEEVLSIKHLDDIILYALDYLIAHYPDRLVERYNLSGQFEDKVAVLDEIGQKRGFLQSGGYVDYDKVYEILLREIRSVKLGRLSFELPSDIPTSEEK